MSTVSDLSRKKRSRGYVTKNACTECRRRKARCDGLKPCTRCSSLKGVTCQYAVSVQVSKESMRADIEELQSHRQVSEHVLNSLAAGDQAEFILQQLRGGETLDDISKSLDLISPYGSTRTSSQMNWEPGPASSGTESWSISPNDGGGRNRDETPDFPFDSGASINQNDADWQYLPEGEQWTSLTSDSDMVEHLMSLYFCWEYPIFASLSKRHLLEDFRARRRRYCSRLLINAILALGCRFSDRHSMTADLDSSETAADQLFAEAERLWQAEQNNPSLTTIQATALMSIREASYGRDNRSWFYSGQSIRMAVELGLHAHTQHADMDDDEYEVRSITFWGAFTLDEAWSLSTGRLPYLSRNGCLPVSKPAVIESDEKSVWIPYTDDGEQSESSLHQRSNGRSVFDSFCSLSEVVHQSLYILYAPGGALTSQDVLGIYKRYMDWYDSIPQVLRTGDNSTPAVLFTHMYYHFAILLLFGPFIKFRFLNSSISPKEVCVQAAAAIASLVGSYRQLYSLRRTPCFVPYIVLASSIMHFAAADTTNPPINASMQIFQGTADLLEIAPSHEFARRGAQVLRVMAQSRNTADAGVVKTESGRTDEDLKDRLRSRLTTGETNFFSPNMEDLLLKRCSLTDNSIFLPFPTQDLLLLDNEMRLRRDGFELIR